MYYDEQFPAIYVCKVAEAAAKLKVLYHHHVDVLEESMVSSEIESRQK
jgi:hypothetical protein